MFSRIRLSPRVFTLCGVALLCVGQLNTAKAADLEKQRPAEPTTPAEIYGETVRRTEPKSPQDELAGFHVPEGLVVQLVASEPQIAKPMNIAFDARGRLWVTESTEYPYPYREEKDEKKVGPQDKIKILEDRDGDGLRETVSTFADGLNVPIGLLPYADGVICFSIPNVLFLRDTNGDGVCDSREVIVGPFDTTRDTHGMVNSLRLGLDGWIYACHGFNNQSKVQGADGHSITLISGNTFRFRPDGSRVELVSQGQVNPFGMTQDVWGDWYTADCHSKPISQIVRGGCYPSFGRPDDGLGFVPSTMEHLHGSTAIAGVAIGTGSSLPNDFQENFFSGNVMTCRINRNQIDRVGATVKAVELPDLLTSEDAWFRPVDLQLGPDGWIYVADFYNKVIGHYEVPLDHPGRDRFRGRIWRIGATSTTQSNVISDIKKLEDFVSGKGTTKNYNDLISLFASNNPTVRRLAIQSIVQTTSAADRAKVIPAMESAIKSASTNSSIRTGSLWAMVQLTKQLPTNYVELLKSQDEYVLTQAFMAALDLDVEPNFRSSIKQVARTSISEQSNKPNANVHAAAAAVEWIGRWGESKDVKLLVDRLASVQSSDPILSAKLKIAIRHLLRNDAIRNEVLSMWANNPASLAAKKLDEAEWVAVDSPQADTLLPIVLALNPDQIPGDALLAYLEKKSVNRNLLDVWLPRIATTVSENQLPGLLQILEKSYADSSNKILEVIDVVVQQQRAKTASVPDTLRQFAERFVSKEIDRIAQDLIRSSASERVVRWREIGEAGRDPKPWGIETRANDKGEKIPVFSSLTLGESYVGQWVSGQLPPVNVLSFVLVGHNGVPDNADHHLNRVDLIDLKTGEVLETAYPPRNDSGIRVSWDLSPFASKAVGLSVTDADKGTAYAWIAVGGFSLDGLNPDGSSKTWDRILKISDSIGGLKMLPNSAPFEGLEGVDVGWKIQLALVYESQKSKLPLQLAQFAWKRGWIEVAELAYRSGVAEGATQSNSNKTEATEEIDSSLQPLARLCNASDRSQLVLLLSSRPSWHPALYRMIQKGWVGNESLAVLEPAWWTSNAQSEAVVGLSKLRPDMASLDAAKNQGFNAKQSRVAKLQGDASRGQALFKQHCALCHQVGGQGAVLGPQLEGVGGRGLDRLCEDIMMPHRNIDEAFRTSSLLLDSGSVVTGLIRRRDDSQVVLVDSKGVESIISTKDIEQESGNYRSLMPDNFSEALQDQELADLIGYLQQLTRKGSGK